MLDRSQELSHVQCKNRGTFLNYVHFSFLTMRLLRPRVLEYNHHDFSLYYSITKVTTTYNTLKFPFSLYLFVEIFWFIIHFCTAYVGNWFEILFLLFTEFWYEYRSSIVSVKITCIVDIDVIIILLCQYYYWKFLLLLILSKT